MKLVTVEEMRALERAAIEAGSSEAQLMEEAGLAVAQEAWMHLGSLEGRRIAVLCGPGNNGGDGLVAARHLLDWGAEVIVYLAEQAREPDRVAAIGEREGVVAESGEDAGYGGLEALLASSDLVVDALLGIGKGRPIDEDSPIGACLARLAAARGGAAPPKLIAVDIPSGLNADSGAIDPLAVEPDLTVTFGLPKVGMYQAPGGARVGRVQVIDIGIPAAVMESVALELMTSRDAREAIPDRPEAANKGTFGRVLILGGCDLYPGAPALTARGAYAAGAGLVTIASTFRVQSLITASIPEATWLPQAAGNDGFLVGDAAQTLRSEWSNSRAAVVGPGLGNTDETRALVWAVLPDLASLEQGAVIDADALNAVATFDDGPDRIPSNAVLTPHPGEMARLLRTTVAEVQSNRLETAREAAQRFRCTVVLKGAHSIVAGPGGATALSPFGNALLATAGSGDVLSGAIAAYLAQGLAPFDAARLGVYAHAATGEALSEDLGSSGLLAGDLARKLPSVMREVSAP